LKSLAEVIGLANDNLGADLERSLPILRSCYFIADSVDLVHILVTEKSDPTKAARNRPNLGIRHPHGMLTLLDSASYSARRGQFL
jgi:hypothetical protein